MNAAAEIDNIPAIIDARNHGKVMTDFLNLSHKKTTTAGNATLSIKSSSIHIPFINIL